MRLFPWLPLAVLAAGVGFAAPDDSDWAGRPKTAPPRLRQSGPPPAWAETRTRSIWLAYGSYCWGTLCVDMILPSARKDIPRIIVARGRVVRVHLGFVPRTASVVVFTRGKSTTLRLKPQRILVWRPRTAALTMVDVRGTRGSASYLLHVRRSA